MLARSQRDAAPGPASGNLQQLAQVPSLRPAPRPVRAGHLAAGSPGPRRTPAGPGPAGAARVRPTSAPAAMSAPAIVASSKSTLTSLSWPSDQKSAPNGSPADPPPPASRPAADLVPAWPAANCNQIPGARLGPLGRAHLFGPAEPGPGPGPHPREGAGRMEPNQWPATISKRIPAGSRLSCELARPPGRGLRGTV